MAKSDNASTDKASGSSGSSRWLSVAATLGLLTLVGSCCVCGGIGYREWPTFASDPQAATAMTEEIVPVSVPAVFTPQGTIDWQIWMLLQMRGSYYTLSTGEGELSFLEVDSRFIDNPEFRDHIVNSMREHGAGGGFDLAVKRVTEKAYDVNGQSVTFSFLEGKDRTSGTQRRLVDGIVPGHRGPVMISLWVNEANWDPQMVDDLIASIGPTAKPAPTETLPSDPPTGEDVPPSQ